ncbi:MAG: DUF4956 domain-containing protein [Oscillospiraceae bacterium]|jgi:hypothetical protein|nr:DUF4956 domain-containing protein [Oscillospiraceae bacterium]
MGELIKGSAVEFFQSQLTALTPLKVGYSIILGLVAGVVIALVYRRTFRGVLFSQNFSITLIMLAMVTTPVVICIKSDLALSMGMVGALSIVRFRTAVKDPLDTAYMFWALTTGILLGAELFLIAFVVLGLISLVMLGISLFKLTGLNTFLLVLHYDPAFNESIEAAVTRIKNRRLRSKTVSAAGAELTLEIRVDPRSDIVSHMLSVKGVFDATLVATQNEAAN